MDNYNPDLILDLAAGILPEPEARAAEASLSAEGRAELEAQRAVLAAIVSAPPVGMTDIERAHLHRFVNAELADATRELSPARVATPAVSPRRRRSVAWMRWASAATVAAMLVGVVAVGTQLSGDLFPSDDASADTTIFAEADATLESARDNADAGAASELAPLTGGTLLSAPSTTTPAPPRDGGDLEVASRLLVEAPALEEAPEDSDLQGLTDFVTDFIDARRSPIDGITTLPCYAVAAEDDDLDVILGYLVPYPGPNGQVNAIAFSDSGTDTTDPLIRLYDPATCEPLAVNN